MNERKARKYLVIAQSVAALSKDQSTKVGALIIGEDGEGGPWGYNGAPRGCLADEDERMQHRPEKYLWAEHAERNAIYAAARKGFPTRDCSIVVTHAPCMDCARAIVQAGIKHVWVPKWDGNFAMRWQEHIIRMRRLFDECGVSFHIISNEV